VHATASPDGFANSDGETLTVVRGKKYITLPAPAHLDEALSPRLWRRFADFNPLEQALGLLYRARAGLAGGQMPEYVGREWLDGREVIRVQGPIGLLQVDPRAPRGVPTRVIAWLDAEPPHLPVRMNVLSAEKSPEARQAMEEHLPKHLDDFEHEILFVRTIQVIEFHNWNLDRDVATIHFSFTPDEDMREVESIEQLRRHGRTAQERRELLQKIQELLDKRRREREAARDRGDEDTAITDTKEDASTNPEEGD